MFEIPGAAVCLLVGKKHPWKIQGENTCTYVNYIDVYMHTSIIHMYIYIYMIDG